MPDRPAGTMPPVETTWEPLPGGWSGESFLSRVDGRAEVVRVYARPGVRGEHAAEVDAALARWVRGLVPTPEVLEVRPGTDGTPPLLVTEYVAGVRADDVVRDLVAHGDGGSLHDLGRELGVLAGTLAGIATPRPGQFLDGDLVPRAVAGMPDDLTERVEQRLPQLRGFDDELARRLRRVAERAQDELDTVRWTSLVHGDLGPRNVVLADDARRVAAVVDWEHAHSGSPYADLGTLVRFDRDPAWEQGVMDGWVAVRGGSPERALDLARCADLHALVELASRPGGNLVVDLAEVFLAEVARTGDWHAHP